MIKIILATLFTLFICDAIAQRTKTVELKGITRQGLVYYYDLKKVDGGAYGLQIPLQSLQDEQVNHYYKSFKQFRVLEGIIALVPIFYFLYYVVPQHHYYDPKTFWIVWGSSVAAMILVEIKAKSQLNKGIDRYNRIVLEPGTRASGLSITFKF